MIAAQLLPSMPEQQQSLMQSIVSLNPSAFINRDPNRLRANIRLWLPGNGLQTHDVSPDPNAGQETQYSWGTIKKRANN